MIRRIENLFELPRVVDSIIFFDVDGTLVADGGNLLNKDTISILEKTKENNSLFFISNKRAADGRNKVVSKQIGVVFLEGKKPWLKIPLDLANSGKKNIVVGDKFLTDGLFAIWNDADFFKVDHFRSKSDSLLIKISYMVDDVAFFVFSAVCLFRIKHWIKNLFVFAPLFFAKDIFDVSKLLNVSVAFFAFSFCASGVYAINDIFDRKIDGNHPHKRGRPVASGAISPLAAGILSVCLFTLGLFLASTVNFALAQILLAYIFLNIVYSLYLKNIPILDIVAIAAMYDIRVEAGALAADVFMSRWIILSVFFVSLLLAIGKRMAETKQGVTRDVLKDYGNGFLTQALYLTAGLTIVTYGVYCILGVESPLAVYSIVFVVTGVFKYLLALDQSDKGAEYPERLVLSDRTILFSILCWVVYMFLIFYF
ncbi:MAG: UbiA family prenyltransferase [Candidatus Paceibacterota bacterium]|jgi:4-hydroxybenzoate polyprenyltransferase